MVDVLLVKNPQQKVPNSNRTSSTLSENSERNSRPLEFPPNPETNQILENINIGIKEGFRNLITQCSLYAEDCGTNALQAAIFNFRSGFLLYNVPPFLSLKRSGIKIKGKSEFLARNLLCILLYSYSIFRM